MSSLSVSDAKALKEQALAYSVGASDPAGVKAYYVLAILYAGLISLFVGYWIWKIWRIMRRSDTIRLYQKVSRDGATIVVPNEVNVTLLITPLFYILLEVQIVFILYHNKTKTLTAWPECILEAAFCIPIGICAYVTMFSQATTLALSHTHNAGPIAKMYLQPSSLWTMCLVPLGIWILLTTGFGIYFVLSGRNFYIALAKILQLLDQAMASDISDTGFAGLLAMQSRATQASQAYIHAGRLWAGSLVLCSSMLGAIFVPISWLFVKQLHRVQKGVQQVQKSTTYQTLNDSKTSVTANVSRFLQSRSQPYRYLLFRGAFIVAYNISSIASLVVLLVCAMTHDVSDLSRRSAGILVALWVHCIFGWLLALSVLLQLIAQAIRNRSDISASHSPKVKTTGSVQPMPNHMSIRIVRQVEVLSMRQELDEESEELKDDIVYSSKTFTDFSK